MLKKAECLKRGDVIKFIEGNSINCTVCGMFGSQIEYTGIPSFIEFLVLAFEPDIHKVVLQCGGATILVDVREMIKFENLWFFLKNVEPEELKPVQAVA